VRPAWAQSNGRKSRVRVDSAKHIAKSKGIHRKVESEGSWSVILQNNNNSNC